MNLEKVLQDYLHGTIQYEEMRALLAEHKPEGYFPELPDFEPQGRSKDYIGGWIIGFYWGVTEHKCK